MSVVPEIIQFGIRGLAKKNGPGPPQNVRCWMFGMDFGPKRTPKDDCALCPDALVPTLFHTWDTGLAQSLKLTSKSIAMEPKNTPKCTKYYPKGFKKEQKWSPSGPFLHTRTLESLVTGPADCAKRLNNDI